MSIERQLVEAFKHNKSTLECPPSLDARIMAEYGRMTMDKKGNSLMKKKSSLPRVAIIALVVAILCGFAYAGNKFLFSDSQGHYSISMQANEAFSLNQDILNNARTSIKEVQTQLAPGETAVVYLPEVSAQFNGDQPIIGVTSPELVTDVQQWRAVLEEHGVTQPLPDSLLGGTYKFAEGATNSPFHFMMGQDARDLLDEMKLESKKTDRDGSLWRLTDIPADHPVSFYTSVYRDADGEALYLTWEVVTGTSVKVEGITSSGTEYVELDLNGQKAHYTKNDQSLYGDSNVLQDAMWIVEKDGVTVVYHVESDSANMTKEQLIEVAKSLL